MNFGMITSNQNMMKMQNFVIWIQTASLSMLKQTFAKTFQKMLQKIDISNYETDRPLPIGKNKKVIRLNKKPLKFQDYNNCLKAARKERTINYLEKKIRINVDSPKGDQKSIMFSLKSLITLL